MASALDDLLVLANTQHGPGAHYRVRVRGDVPNHDHLDTPADARAFLAGHDVAVPARPPTAAELADLRRLRSVARGLLAAGRGAADPGLADVFGRARYRLDSEGELRSAHAGWLGVTEALLPGLHELGRARDRLRVCGNPQCRFLFLDRSRNGNRRWCEMAVCGNRVKGRRFRHRLTAAGAPLRAEG